MTFLAPKTKKENKNAASQGWEHGHIGGNIASSPNKSEMYMVNTPLTPLIQLKYEESDKDEYVNLSVQPKLKVGRPNDQYEKEADTVADKMMGSSK